MRNNARILLNATIVNFLTTFTKLVYQKLTRDADASRNNRGKMSLQSHQSQVKCVEKTEILKLCDKYFEEDVPEYYFDR